MVEKKEERKIANNPNRCAGSRSNSKLLLEGLKKQ